MARNEEKAQSMLYRFREAQAAELGLGTRSDRRPRMASACKSLRDCERWRGEILREISRKVSKIQDAGLSDYEVRDLNDEINKLLREKRHWENQIVSLGGANYRRNVAMLDDDGKEVPGTKGYKYFGRAKDLPGVKELFSSRKKDEEEENLALNFYKKFMNQGPAYYGDLDEQDPTLLEYERKQEEEDWEDAYHNLQEAFDLPDDSPIPPLPRQAATPASAGQPAEAPPPTESEAEPTKKGGKSKATKGKGKSKRKTAGDEDGDVAMAEASDTKKAKTETVPPATAAPSTTSAVEQHARAAAAFIPFLTPEELMSPKIPNREEMEGVLLALRKRALVEEYFGTEGEAAA